MAGGLQSGQRDRGTAVPRVGTAVLGSSRVTAVPLRGDGSDA
jgi:hypothetical protein